MNGVRILLSVWLLAVFSPVTVATVSVDSLNYPVWAERGSLSVPLAPGDRLQDGDVVHTGETGRVWLKVDDGSVIKLGQAAQFAVGQASFRKDEQAGVLEATFHVLKGAFRFTSAFFSNEPAQRDVDIQVGAITAGGIHGADIWGRSTDEEDFVALLEGRIEMTSQGQEAVTLDRPLARYRKANGKTVDRVTRVDSSAINEFTAGTELNDTLGIADGVGNYALVLLSLSDDQLVEAAIRRFHEAGYAVQARIVDVAGKLHTRIQLEGLIHKASAGNLRRAIIDAGLVKDAWINPIL